jgi:molybdopterin-containing oxidoreductase family iron-sulfur binding subunit
MDRRTFLKIVGMGGVSMAVGCSPDPYSAPRPKKHLFSLVNAPEDMVTGRTSWYATTCRECPAGCGVLAGNREGRLIKVEGNPLHPINRGKLCMRGQAALQGVYNPDRISTPLLKRESGWRSITFTEAQRLLSGKLAQAAGNGDNRVRMVTEVVGDTVLQLCADSLAQWKSPPPLVFEPFAYEALKSANEIVFGVNGLPSYRMEQADVVVAFGADFLETWLSPVEYARKFKQMHALNEGRKGRFFFISPYESLTGTNADLWLDCQPGSEAIVVLGLIRETLKLGRSTGLSRNLRYQLENAASTYSKAKVNQLTGISVQDFERVAEALRQADRPLVLGTGLGNGGPNALQTDVAVNLLNLILDSDLSLFDFEQRHRVEVAASRFEVKETFRTLANNPPELLLLNNVNPVYAEAGGGEIAQIIQNPSVFTVAFSHFMDETTALADLIFPVRHPLESWDEYSGKQALVSTLQPAMGDLTGAPMLGDLLLDAAAGQQRPTGGYKAHLVARMISKGEIKGELDWLTAVRDGGIHQPPARRRYKGRAGGPAAEKIQELFSAVEEPQSSGLVFAAAPTLRFFDGRGANRPWLCEIPDPVTRVAWQMPVMVHPDTLAQQGLKHGDAVRVKTGRGELQAPAYRTHSVRPGMLVMGIGQGHTAYGRYAKGQGANPLQLLSPQTDPRAGGPIFVTGGVELVKSAARVKLANTDGSRSQQGRKIALTVGLDALEDLKKRKQAGLAMWDFPLVLPLPEGYDPKRDFYEPHEHDGYRWAMVVDMERCIGCGACAAGCYAENNIGIVGEQRVANGREMAWLSVERYEDHEDPRKLVFLPLMCQHCDNAPCESVCPVYAPHHNKEGMNNQIYNRCIGTRYCSQNCPYKVRRFNWFNWKWPRPLDLQLNPNVTVRAKGVMEKCSFCIQRIKDAHNEAKNENRKIRDGEIIPACVQTCPTDALTFGNLMDPDSRVRKLAADPRAYQVMGYLNTKPAVFYLKKVTQQV